jgi:hypothetical protein
MYRKLSDMCNFARGSSVLVRRRSSRIKQTLEVPYEMRTSLSAAKRPRLRQKISTNRAPARQFVRFSDRFPNLFSVLS